MSENEGSDDDLWWGKPRRARRFHVFQGKHGLAESLCSGGWLLAYDGGDPDVDPDEDTFKDGRDCKACARKVGVLADGR